MATIPRNHGANLLFLVLWGLGMWLSFQVGVLGWFLSPVLSAAVGWLWYRHCRPQRVPLRAGETPCPQCRSLQTDRELVPLPDGRDGIRMHCFACDHRWPAT